MNHLKTIYLFIFLFSFSSLSFPQSDTNEVIKFSERIPAELELELKVKENGAIGYADCFKGTVLKVNRGTLEDAIILITVVAGDNKNYNILTSGNEDTVYKIYCMHNKDNEEYRTTYITGFVDSKKTSWKIVYLISISKNN